MTFADRNRKFLAKLRSLPDTKKKIILWTVVAVIGLTMGFFWVMGTINSLSKAGGEIKNIKIPAITVPNMPDLSKLQNIPALDMLQTASPSIQTLLNQQGHQ